MGSYNLDSIDVIKGKLVYYVTHGQHGKLEIRLNAVSSYLDRGGHYKRTHNDKGRCGYEEIRGKRRGRAEQGKFSLSLAGPERRGRAGKYTNIFNQQEFLSPLSPVFRTVKKQSDSQENILLFHIGNIRYISKYNVPSLSWQIVYCDVVLY